MTAEHGRRWADTFSFVTGVARDAGTVALAMVSDELAREQTEHTVPIVWANGKWVTPSQQHLNFTTVAMAVCERPKRQAVFLGLHGNAFFMGAGDEHQEVVRTSTVSPESMGLTRCIRTIDGDIYVGGVRRQLYRRTGIDRWEYIGVDPAVSQAEKDISGFEAIDGFGADEIYAAGWNGEIWLRKAGAWHRLPSPVNTPLTGLCCAPDGHVYACGRSGVVVRGGGEQWERLDAGKTKQDVWSSVAFEGKVYCATSYQLFELKNDLSLEPVQFDGPAPRSTFHLSTAPAAMLSIGSKDLMLLSGGAWTHLD